MSQAMLLLFYIGFKEVRTLENNQLISSKQEIKLFCFYIKPFAKKLKDSY